MPFLAGQVAPRPRSRWPRPAGFSAWAPDPGGWARHFGRRAHGLVSWELLVAVKCRGSLRLWPTGVQPRGEGGVRTAEAEGTRWPAAA